MPPKLHLLLCVLLVSVAKSLAADPPNILHILTDDLLLTELRGIQSSFRSEADHDHLVKATSLAACLSAEASAKAEEATKNWQAVLTPRAA